MNMKIVLLQGLYTLSTNEHENCFTSGSVHTDVQANMKIVLLQGLYTLSTSEHENCFT